MSALLGAISGVVLLLDQAALDVYRFWTVGSLAGSRGLDSLSLVAPLMIAGAILAAAQSRSLDALALGSDMARSLGRRLLPVQIAGLLSVTPLVGGATALVGSLGFVGLVAPHIARGSSDPPTVGSCRCRRCSVPPSSSPPMSSAACSWPPQSAGRHRPRHHRRAGLPHPRHQALQEAADHLDALGTADARIGAVSLRWSPRTLFVTLVAAISTVVLAVLSLGAGEMSLRPDRVLAVLTGGGTEQERLIVLTLRLTRTVLGILVGAMLALSGAIVQTTTRNGLASPDLLGVTAGAGTGAVAVIVLGGTGPTASGMSTLLHGLGTSAAARSAVSPPRSRSRRSCAWPPAGDSRCFSSASAPRRSSED